MKKAKIINIIFWVAAWLALSFAVCFEWHRLGCGVWSLIVACAFYGACSTALWATCHDFIKHKEQEEL